MAVALTLCLALVWSVPDTPRFGTQADDEQQLAWTKDEGQELFDQGKAAFEEGKFKEAYGVFKKARGLAKGRTTKQIVKNWQDGAEGGFQLGELRKKAEEGSKRDVFATAEKLLDGYRETPIGDAYITFLQELQTELFETLEDFERVSGRYSEKYGKKFVKEAEKVREGKTALEWEIDQGLELKVKDLPRNLASYRAVSFWLCFPGPVKSNYQIVFKGLGKGQTDYGDTVTNAFIKQMEAHSGWKRIEIPFKQFNMQGDVAWESITDFRIQFVSKKKATVYVDYIALVK